jgi:hypothetical protein
MNNRRRLIQKVRIQTYTGHTYTIAAKRTSNEKIKFYLDKDTIKKLVILDLYCGINRFHYISNGEYSFYNKYNYSFFSGDHYLTQSNRLTARYYEYGV